MKSVVRSFVVISWLFLLPSWALAGSLEITEAWVRMPPPVADTAAGYMRLKNTGNQQIEIVKIESDVASLAEFHEMTMHDGMMHMGKMDAVRIEPGEVLVFASGGKHLMLIGLNKELDDKSIVRLKLIDQHDVAYKFDMDVRDMRQASKQHQHHH